MNMKFRTQGNTTSTNSTSPLNFSPIKQKTKNSKFEINLKRVPLETASNIVKVYNFLFFSCQNS